MNYRHAVIRVLDDLPDIGIVEYVYAMLDIGNSVSALTANSAAIANQNISFLRCSNHRYVGDHF